MANKILTTYYNSFKHNKCQALK